MTYPFDFASGPLGTMRIYIDDNLPPSKVEYCRIWPAHPLIIWFSKYVNIRPWVMRVAYHEEHCGYRLGSNLMLSTSLYNELKKHTILRSENITA